MKVRFYVDPESGEPHVGLHAVGEEEVRNVLARPLEDRPGRDGSRVALGQTAAGRYLRVIYVRLGVRNHRVRARPKGKASTPASPGEETMTKHSQFPPGWDEARVRRLLESYQGQSDEEAVAEDEASFEATTHTAMEVPVDLVPTVRELIAKHRRSA